MLRLKGLTAGIAIGTFQNSFEFNVLGAGTVCIMYVLRQIGGEKNIIGWRNRTFTES